MLWIVSGSGSAGKSTFLQSSRCLEITGLSAGTPVIWPDQVPSELRRSPQRDALLHYSLFQRHRAYNKLLRKASRQEKRKGNRMVGPLPFPTFDDDPNWVCVARAKIPRQAIVLVASKLTILARMRDRPLRETAGFRSRDEQPYNAEKQIDRVQRIDLLALYEEWLASLRKYEVPYILLSSEDDTYPIIADANLATLLGNDRAGAGVVPPSRCREPFAALLAVQDQLPEQVLQEQRS